VTYYLGLDFGGTKLALGVADATGRLVASRRRPTDPATGPEGAVATLEHMALELGNLARDVAAVGISFGGPVGVDRSRTLLSHHGPGWEDYHLVERVAVKWSCPIAMDNDANAAALGEARFGAAAGQRNVLYVTVSTGIGGGVVVNGHLYRGSRGLAGEIGHMVVFPGGPTCTCGKRGCLEATSAGPSIAREYLTRAHAPHGIVTAAEVFARAAGGERLAREVIGEAIHFLGAGLANAVNLLDPDVVVIGGGVSQAGDALFLPLRAAMREWAAPSPPGAVPVLPAALGEAVGILGAIALVAPTDGPVTDQSS
jgi:glucokinase